jgi:hypothetical protein
VVDRNTAGCFAMLLWILWKNRNDKVWNDVKETGRSLGFKALQAWQQWSSPRFSSIDSLKRSSNIKVQFGKNLL